MRALRLEGEELVHRASQVGAGDHQEATQREMSLGAEQLQEREELRLAEGLKSPSLSELAGASEEAADEAVGWPLADGASEPSPKLDVGEVLAEGVAVGEHGCESLESFPRGGEMREAVTVDVEEVVVPGHEAGASALPRARH